MLRSRGSYDPFARLYVVMNEEVALLRELLGLFMEIEQSLLQSEQENLPVLLEKKSSIQTHLKSLQKDRAEAVKFCLNSYSDNNLDKTMTSDLFTKVMSFCDEFGTETISLKDQILQLLKKIDEQKKQILSLSTESSLELPIQLEPSSEEEKGKTTLKTIDPDDPIESQT